MIEKEAVRVVYDKLCAQYGRAAIDSVTCPCWDETATSLLIKGWGRPNEIICPYEDFVDNMKVFLSILEKCEVDTSEFVGADGMAEWRVALEGGLGKRPVYPANRRSPFP